MTKFLEVKSNKHLQEILFTYLRQKISVYWFQILVSCHASKIRKYATKYCQTSTTFLSQINTSTEMRFVFQILKVRPHYALCI